MAGGMMGRTSPLLQFRGWRMVTALAITEPISWGVLYYAFGALIVPMQNELGWSLADLTAGFSLATLVAGLAAIPVGRWVDRNGARWVMTAASLLGVLMVLAWSRVESLPLFLAIWVGIGLAQSGTLYEPAFAAVAGWFRRYRSRALLILTITGGFASTIFLPLTGWLAESRGWRETLVMLAILLAVVTVPLHALVLRRRPEDEGLAPDGEPPAMTVEGKAEPLPPPEGVTVREALDDPGFRWLAAAFWLATIVSIAAGVHFIPYLTEKGESPTFAAAAAGAIGAAQVLARLVVTALGTRFSLKAITGGVFLLQGISVLLMLAGGRAVLLLAVLLLGAGRGALTLIRADIVASRYGRAHFGAISGVMALWLVGARALAPVGIGWLAVAFGGYDPVMWLLAGAGLLSALAMIPVRPVEIPGLAPAD
jgi:sugar phosphate permease